MHGVLFHFLGIFAINKHKVGRIILIINKKGPRIVFLDPGGTILRMAGVSGTYLSWENQYERVAPAKHFHPKHVGFAVVARIGHLRIALQRDE